MANFGLKFRFLDSNNNCCDQKDSSSKSATKVYASRCTSHEENPNPNIIYKNKLVIM